MEFIKVLVSSTNILSKVEQAVYNCKTFSTGRQALIDLTVSQPTVSTNQTRTGLKQLYSELSPQQMLDLINNGGQEHLQKERYSKPFNHR